MTKAPPTIDRRSPATARKRIDRQTVDLSAYPDLVVIYLGMRVNLPTGIKTLAGFGPQIQKAAGQKPDGLLLHENLIYGLFPPHIGMRQYWRDFDSLERWSRSEPHRRWWQNFLRDSGGTGFWHETYFIRGGFESIYDDMAATIGMMAFAPLLPARGAMFGARRRLHLAGDQTVAPPLTESDLYRREPAETAR
ncbi:MAG: DUF4188 domain-containing protein [Dehalococcoidia bacterium]